MPWGREEEGSVTTAHGPWQDRPWRALPVFELGWGGRARIKRDAFTGKLGIDYFFSSGQMCLKLDSRSLNQCTRSPQPTPAASVAAGVPECHGVDGRSFFNELLLFPGIIRWDHLEVLFT